MSGKKIDKSFYQNDDVVALAKELLGKKLVTNFNGGLTSGLITELEAYSGRNDKACHANGGRRTARTEVMYSEGGVAYVYLCYGIHHMFNVVTNIKDRADAILIRAVEPVEGIDLMQERRNVYSLNKKLTAGPGSLGKAFGFNSIAHTGMDLSGDLVWLEHTDLKLTKRDIVATTRIGIAYAEEDALKPWRFYIKGNQWVSRK